MSKVEVVWVRLKDLESASWNINEMDYETFLSLLDDMNKKDGPHRINPIRVRPIGENKYQIIVGVDISYFVIWIYVNL